MALPARTGKSTDAAERGIEPDKLAECPSQCVQADVGRTEDQGHDEEIHAVIEELEDVAGVAGKRRTAGPLLRPDDRPDLEDGSQPFAGTTRPPRPRSGRPGTRAASVSRRPRQQWPPAGRRSVQPAQCCLPVRFAGSRRAQPSRSNRRRSHRPAAARPATIAPLKSRGSTPRVTADPLNNASSAPVARTITRAAAAAVHGIRMDDTLPLATAKMTPLDSERPKDERRETGRCDHEVVDTLVPRAKGTGRDDAEDERETGPGQARRRGIGRGSQNAGDAHLA